MLLYYIIDIKIFNQDETKRKLMKKMRILYKATIYAVITEIICFAVYRIGNCFPSSIFKDYCLVCLLCLYLPTGYILSVFGIGIKEQTSTQILIVQSILWILMFTFVFAVLHKIKKKT